MLLDLDLIRLDTGEILTVYGSYRGDLCRARITFVPDSRGDRTILGKNYKKIRFDTYGTILGCEKVLNLPGEEQYIVQMAQIDAVFPAKRGFEKISEEEKAVCDDLSRRLYHYCAIATEDHGLGGSSAVGCRNLTSDFDWIIYDRSAIERLKRYLASSSEFKKCFPFEVKYAVEKYKRITILPPGEVLHLFFKRKWKYFRFKERVFSLSFVPPDVFADAYLEEYKSGRSVKVTGSVIDNHKSFQTPKVISIECSDGSLRDIMSWLFLYSGAFEVGDVIEATGEITTINGMQYTVVWRKEDYIKVIS